MSLQTEGNSFIRRDENFNITMANSSLKRNGQVTSADFMIGLLPIKETNIIPLSA